MTNTSGGVHCDRCGYEVPNGIALWVHQHRFGVLSECDRRLIRSLLPWNRRDLQTGADGGQPNE
jgi:hypothetical protein